MKRITYLITLISIPFTSCNTSHDSTDNGLIIKESPYDFDTTYNKLRTIIDSNPNLNILLELDHSSNAASVNLNLNPTRIILFGNPKLGTPLMQNQQTTSIDLPQKIIVYTEDNNSIKIAYNNPMYLQERHQIKDNDEILNKISGALHKITEMVIAEE